MGLVLSPSFFLLQQFFCDLLKRFCNHHLNFRRQGTIRTFSTPNCQSDPEWNLNLKLETQKDLLSWFPSQDFITESPYKKNLTDSLHRVRVLTNFRVYCKSFISSMNCWFIELKAFLLSIFKIVFSLGMGFSIKQRKSCEGNSAPRSVPIHTCRLPILT